MVRAAACCIRGTQNPMRSILSPSQQPAKISCHRFALYLHPISITSVDRPRYVCHIMLSASSNTKEFRALSLYEKRHRKLMASASPDSWSCLERCKSTDSAGHTFMNCSHNRSLDATLKSCSRYRTGGSCWGLVPVCWQSQGHSSYTL